MADAPSLGMHSMMVMDDEEDKASIFAAEILSIADSFLTQRERCVLRFIFVHDLTANETAQRMLLTHQRVSMIKNTGIQRLRSRLSASGSKVHDLRKTPAADIDPAITAYALLQLDAICEIMRQIDACAGDAEAVKALAASAVELIEDCGAGLEGLPTE